MNDAPNNELTDQQQRAVDVRGTSVVLSAIAGCGKTRVLTERYISHLVKDRAAINEIVAFTFTDKAAREMRKRIRTLVRQRSKQAASDEEKRWWRDQERDLDLANIGTIHAFCTQLLQRFALLAGLDPNLEVLDETIAPNVRDNTARVILYALLDAEGALAESLRELVRWYGWGQTQAGINQLMVASDPSQWAEWIEKSTDEWIATWAAARQSHFDEMNRPGGSIANLLSTINQIRMPGPKIADRVAIILHELPTLSSSKNPATVLAKIREAACVKGAESKSNWPNEDDYEHIKDALTGLRKLIDTDIAPLFAQQPDLVRAADIGQMFLRVAIECDRAYTTEKQKRGAIDFNDQLVLARDLLQQHKAVRNACQRKYKFLLVDELQDTDPVQMEIIELLVGKGLTTGKMFAVGDANQSIYRFRGAEVTLFTQLRDQMSADGRLSLTVNYRSQPAILRFVNALLCPDIPNFEPLTPHVPQITKEPCVEFLWTPVTDETNVKEDRSAEAAGIAARIKQMVSNGEKIVTDRNHNPFTPRPVEAKDIVLLFRAMTNVAIYEKSLRDAGLDYYIVGGRAFYAQQEIYDILNLLQAIGNPLDSLALAGVLRSPIGCISDDGLYQLSQDERGLWAALTDSEARAELPADDRAPAERIAKWMRNWRELKDRLPISQLLNRMIADSGYDAALQYEPLGDRKLANLWKLIDQARAFDAAGGFTLDDFVRNLEDLVSAQPREEQAATQPAESNVIRLMSIHQAKGLEFPVVFLPDFAAKSGSAHESVAVWDKDLGCVANPPAEEPEPFPKYARKLWREREKAAEEAEELRILYVACTRAADYLVISGSIQDPPKVANERMRVLMKQFGIESGECRDEGIAVKDRPKLRVTSPMTLRPTANSALTITQGLTDTHTRSET
jgi:ATP-dependent helicase/nuclease subunit A